MEKVDLFLLEQGSKTLFTTLTLTRSMNFRVSLKFTVNMVLF